MIRSNTKNFLIKVHILRALLVAVWLRFRDFIDGEKIIKKRNTRNYVPFYIFRMRRIGFWNQENAILTTPVERAYPIIVEYVC